MCLYPRGWKWAARGGVQCQLFFFFFCESHRLTDWGRCCRQTKESVRQRRGPEP